MQSNKTQNVTAGAVRFPLLLRLNQCRRQIVRWNVIKLGHCETHAPLRDLWDWLNHISQDTGTVSSIPIYLSFLKYSRNSCRFFNTQCLEIFERKTFLAERVWLTYCIQSVSFPSACSTWRNTFLRPSQSEPESELSGQRCHSYFISFHPLREEEQNNKNILQRKHEKYI